MVDRHHEIMIKMTILRCVAPCSLVDRYQQLDGTFCLYPRSLRWRQRVPSNPWYLCTKLHGGTSQRAIILKFCVVRALYLSRYRHILWSCLFFPIFVLCLLYEGKEGGKELKKEPKLKTNNTSNILMNVILRRVRVTIVAVENQSRLLHTLSTGL